MIPRCRNEVVERVDMTSLRARRHRVLPVLTKSGIMLWRHQLLYDTSSRSFTDGMS